ncbi:UNVERIFIED_CONTAM: hypothetical protein GTU68_041582 [Idotea baltica]|nr:hypothetical protein [Idotea baltica]
MQITSDKVVLMDYTLKTRTGDVIDTTEGQEPLSYLHGFGMIVPGLETALDGKSVGDNIQVTVEPKDAFGERNDKLRQEVDRKEFAELGDLQIGMQFMVPGDEDNEDDHEMVISIVDLSEETVTVDGNHALAGQTLNFDVTIREIRDATAEELEHGHPHGAGGCEH